MTDRFIQQALLQVLQQDWDETFSDSSSGFRPKRSAHQAVLQAQQYVRAGYRWTVDMDLEKFFDSVNHDILMQRIKRRIDDRTVLVLINRILKADTVSTVNVKQTGQAHPKAGPYPRYWPTCCWMNWIKHWRHEVIVLPATPMIATSTSKASEPVNAYYKASNDIRVIRSNSPSMTPKAPLLDLGAESFWALQ